MILNLKLLRCYKKNVLISDLNKLIKTLNEKIERLSEQDLDKYMLPHPLIGKISIREMLYFTIYHVQHHHKSVVENIKQCTIKTIGKAYITLTLLAPCESLKIHSFLYAINKKAPVIKTEALWCGPGSNRRHKDFQSFALPTELPHHTLSGQQKQGDFTYNPQFNPYFLKFAILRCSCKSDHVSDITHAGNKLHHSFKS